MGPIASQRGSEPEFLRKQLVTCDFPGGRDPSPPNPSESAHELYVSNTIVHYYISYILCNSSLLIQRKALEFNCVIICLYSYILYFK